jgi:DNA-damage-inducible protein D
MASNVEKTPLYKHTMQKLESVKRQNSQGDDYWVGREIHVILGYPAWDKFMPVINRAIESLRSNGIEPSHHIAETSKLVEVGDGGKRRVKEFFLSRGACYLIAMNGDPSKPEIAGAQQYFASQTRTAELLAKLEADRHRLRLREKVTVAAKRVGDAAKDAGVERFALFHNARFEGLYGISSRKVEARKGVNAGESLLDRAGSLELSAHEFQMQLAATKIQNENISGEKNAIAANKQVAQKVRQTVKDETGRELIDIPLEAEPIKLVRKRLTQSKQLPKN